MAMTSYLPNDLIYLFLNSASQPAASPKIGEGAPPIRGLSFEGANGTMGCIIAFVRHCGCPFAEEELHSLGAIANNHPNVRIVIVGHNSQTQLEAWFERIGGPLFPTKASVMRLGDPSLELFNAYGIGQLPFTGVFSLSTIKSALDLAKRGIYNTRTGDGSNHSSWLNSGGFVVDAQGQVCWMKIAERASDVVDYEEAVKALA